MAVNQIKKTPCNGCRERKRKCTYEQPCERCVKAGVECTYTVMPSPKDMEYIQELEYINQIEAIQHQISCMENEIGILRLAKENKSNQKEKQSSPVATKLQNYPSPVSLKNQTSMSFDDHSQRHKYKHRHKPMMLTDPFIDYEGVPPPQQPSPPSDFLQIEPFYKFKRGFKNGRKKHYHAHHHVFKSNNIQVELKSQQQQENESKPWSLTVKNGNMTIETFIHSHAQLMNCLGSMVSTAIHQEKTSQLPFPFNIEPTTHTTAMNKVLSILIWRSYGKSRFKSLTKYTPVLLHSVAPQQLTRIIPVEGLTNITMRLVFTYFQCQHLRHFTVYIPEFVNAYMNEDILQSPAVMALCSHLCQQSCKHGAEILPLDAVREYGLYYFEQARELIEDRFDEISLETLITFTFMALYKIKTKDDVEADKYLSMAERIYTVLLPQFEYKPSSNNEPSGESKLFSRIFRCMHHCRSIIELHDAVNRMFKVPGMGPHRLFRLLDSEDEVKIHIFPGDSPKEVQFIKMKHYICALRQAIKDGARCAEATDFPSYIGVFGHHVEMAMRNWYRNVLPEDYQLSLPLFEDHISDLDFFIALEKDCQESPIPLLTTIALYNEYLIMAKSYIPKNPTKAHLDTEELIRKFKQMQYTTEHGMKDRQDPSTDSHKQGDRSHFWFKVIEKVRYFKKHHQQQFSDDELEQSDEEYFTQFIKALNPSKLNFDMPLIHTSVKSALNTVRIVQFLVSHDFSCFLDLRWIMNAWEVLLRAARFKYQQPDDEAVTLDRIRANLILCLDIVKEQLDWHNRDPEGEFMLEMDQQFKELFV
ncbi:hypothetical protein [Parasitella parasitica]|uniref:Zn(2)-C6 fungal-type domain-containing protein n=1 Tax=Parasitella parasitica TaxID=35722 RepID=A0A0B7MNY0_9FUNG|nr:hypothetical protein [Parasitella parasitica]